MDSVAVIAAKKFIATFMPNSNDKLYQRIEQLYLMLEEYNAHTNLTRISSHDEFWIKHVADSLAIFKFFPQLLNSDEYLLDVGCGAGFPALMLALAAPELKIDAVDSIGKKVAFVESAKQAVNLTNLTTFAARTQELNNRQ